MVDHNQRDNTMTVSSAGGAGKRKSIDVIYTQGGKTAEGTLRRGERDSNFTNTQKRISP